MRNRAYDMQNGFALAIIIVVAVIALLTGGLAGCTSGPRYYVVNFTDASITATSKDADAKQLADSDEFLVIDTKTGERLAENGERRPIHGARAEP